MGSEGFGQWVDQIQSRDSAQMYIECFAKGIPKIDAEITDTENPRRRRGRLTEAWTK